MPKRALIAAVTLALLCVACISSSTPPVNYGVGARFVPFVVDATDDMGQGNSVALTADGLPYVTYFGYAAELAEGEIAVPRPFGAPSLPGVMLSTGSSDGMWQRGAVDMTKPELATSGVAIPFGPVETPNLDLTTDNSNGTAIAVADDGTVHVAWTMGGAVYHATTKLGGSSTVEKVFDLGTTVEQAGPLGRPGITLDGDGAPWIAFTAETSKGQDVHVAHLTGTKWVDTVAATSGACNGCPSPQPTGIGVVGGAPLVVYADPAAGGVASATLHGSTWTTAPVAADASGFGLSFSAAGDTAYAAYYTGAGTVDVATWKDGAWTTANGCRYRRPRRHGDRQRRPLDRGDGRRLGRGVRRVGGQRHQALVRRQRLVRIRRRRARGQHRVRPVAGGIRQRGGPVLVRDDAAEPDDRVPR